MKRFMFLCFFVTIILGMNSGKIHAAEVQKAESSVVIFGAPEDVETTDPENVDEPVTIKQMKENLKDLKSEKEDISYKWDTLNQINGKVVDFLKTDLSDTDIQEIERLAGEYQKRSAFYEKQLRDNSQENFEKDTSDDNDTAAIKKNFIDYKINFYKALVPFIDILKKDAYLDYIKGNIDIEKEDKDIKEKIYKQEEVIEERVDTIKEKIKEHNKTLEEKLEKLIRKTINEKLDGIIESEKMQSLSLDRQISLLNRVVDTLVQNKEKIVAGGQDTEFIKKKIAIYDVVIEVMLERITQLK